MSPEYAQREDPYRPLLNYDATLVIVTSISFESKEELQRGLMDMEVLEYNETDSLNDVFLSIDRISLDRALLDIVEGFQKMGKDVENNDIFMGASPQTEGKLTSVRTQIRGRMLEGRVSIEIPSTRNISKSEVERVFSHGTAYGLIKPDVEKDKGKYVIKPNDLRMPLSVGGRSAILESVKRLGIDPDDAIIAARVVGKPTGDNNLFF